MQQLRTLIFVTDCLFIALHLESNHTVEQSLQNNFIAILLSAYTLMN